MRSCRENNRTGCQKSEGEDRLQVTEVRIKKVSALSKIKAFASITLDGQLVIHNIRIIEGKDGMFIAMPCRKISNGEYKDVVHPIDTAFREYLQKEIITAYENTPDTVPEKSQDAGQTS